MTVDSEDFFLFTADLLPPEALCITHSLSQTDLNVGHYVQIQGRVGKSVPPEGKLLQGKLPWGEVHKSLSPLCEI